MSQRPAPRPALRPRSTLRPSQALRLPMRIWDLPTRLFAPAVALATLVAVVSRHAPAGRAHSLAGYAVLALLLFRVAWGVLGSDTARFAHLLRGPAAVAREVERWRGREPDDILGHGAVGGWWLLLALVAMAAALGSGIAAAAWHAFAGWLLLAVVALTAAAVAASRLVPGRDLWRQMLTGKKRLPAATRAPRLANPLLAAALLAMAVVAAAALRG